jgi:hypothetical protein
MSKRIVTAVLGLCLAAALATSAHARLDHGPIASLYDEDGSREYRAKPKRAYKATTAKRRHARKASARHHARSRKRPSLEARAVTADRGASGSSRGCLQAEARALLNRIESQFGPVQVISTCRPGAVVAGSGRPSKHRYGLAIDFNAGSRKGAIVQWLIANHHSGGTMTYAGMNHIHVDIGPRFVSLGSGRGRSRRTRVSSRG